MRNLILVSLFVATVGAAAADPSHCALVIHGRPALHPEPAGAATYAVADVAVYDGEPIILTATAFGLSAGDDDNWTQRLEWTVTTDAGAAVEAKLRRDTKSTVQAPYAYRLQRNTSTANFRIDPLPPGKYVVSLSWLSPLGGEAKTSRQGFAVYRGDESPLIRAWFLRDRARESFASGTREAYEAARGLMLKAAEANDDPSFYNELGDMSLAWAPPAETVKYYEKALAVAHANLQKRYGAEGEWPHRARQLYRPQASKVAAFRQLAAEYAMKFHDVKIVFERRGAGGMFLMQQRNDGKELRAIPVNE